eukprot:Awhi_evm1s15541
MKLLEVILVTVILVTQKVTGKNICTSMLAHISEDWCQSTGCTAPYLRVFCIIIDEKDEEKLKKAKEAHSSLSEIKLLPFLQDDLKLGDNEPAIGEAVSIEQSVLITIEDKNECVTLNSGLASTEQCAVCMTGFSNWPCNVNLCECASINKG